MNDRDWMDQAACVGTPVDLFFPTKHDTMGRIKSARKVCLSCPVQFECLSYAVVHAISWGVWGGTSTDQRRRLPNSQRRYIHKEWALRYGRG